MPPARTLPGVRNVNYLLGATAALVTFGLMGCGGGSGSANEASADPLKVDSTYGESGTASLALGTPWSAALGIQPDGKLLIANTRVIAPVPSPNAGGLQAQRPVVMRLGTNGSVDRGFGQDGEARIFVKGSDNAVDIQSQVNGRILVAVMAHEPCAIASFQQRCLTDSGSTGSWHNTVAGLTASGGLDTTFGTQGIAEGFGSALMNRLTLAIQADQKPLLLTSADNVPLQMYGRRLRRLLADGSPDAAFNQDVAGQPAQPCEASGEALLALPNGAVITAGGLGGRVYDTPASDPGLCIAAHAGGSQAQTKGGWFSFGETLKEYQLQPHADGGIAIGARTCGVDTCRLSIARFRADGTVNASFGDKGIVRVGVPTNFSLKSFFTQPDGTMVAYGAVAEGPTPSGPSSRYRAVWVGLKADGTPDKRFGEQGIAIQGPTNAEPQKVLRDGLGRWLVVSTEWDSAGNAVLKAQRTAGTSADKL